jgi:KDO2-lipid IV(A) lauroyltransferase
MNVTESAYAAGWRLVRALPRRVTWPLFEAGADLAARRSGPGTRRLAVNLRHVVGPDLPAAELDELVRRGLRSYARYWLEAFRLPAMSREEILRTFHLDGEDVLGAAVASNQGTVIALAHAGNYDMAGAWVAAKGWPITTVAERLKPERVYERFLAYRRSLGMEIIPATGGDRPPVEILADRLRAGSVVPLLADRDLSTRGVEVDFFDGRTKMPPGPALLALRTGAPLYTATLWFERDTAHARLVGPLPVPPDGPLDIRVRQLTQQVADSLAAGIAEHPEDWHMLQRMWPASPGGSAGEPASADASAGNGPA